MVMRKLGRLPAELESLNLFAQIGSASGTGLTIHDPKTTQDFLNQVELGLKKSLENPARLHGWWVQAMFEAMVVGLGSVRLIKTEDTGDCFFEDGESPLKLPDYRVVRADGEHLLVEVKNVAPGNEMKQQRISARELEGMQRYAELTGARLVVAHYWTAPNLWSVVDSSVLSRDAGTATLSMTTAMMANEIEALGDSWIGTRPPLVLSLIADPGRPRAVHPAVGHEKQATFTVGDVLLSCAGRVLTDELEKRIAWFLIHFGRWESHVRPMLSEHGLPERLDVVLEPTDPTESGRQGFAIVGQLSSLYSALFAVATMTEQGDITKLRHEPDPGILANLIPRDYWEREDRDLPIWQFHLQPAIGPAARSAE